MLFLDGTVPVDGRVAVVGARRVVLAHRAQQRTDRPLVELDQCQQRVLHRAPLPAAAAERRPGLGPAVRGRRRPRGQRSYHYQATGGSWSIRSRIRWRSLRFTLLRTTAPPTALLTTKPARAGERSPQAHAGPLHRYEDGRRGAGARPGVLVVPRSRSPRAASAGCRWAARRHDLTGIRRTDGRDPCCGGTRESRGRHGCAYAAGSRGSWRDDGCSAGRCACSLGGSRKNRCLRGAVLAVTVRPRVARVTPECTADRSSCAICAHRRQAAAAIDNSTWLRYARLRHSVKPTAARRHLSTAWGQQLEPYRSR